MKTRRRFQLTLFLCIIGWTLLAVSEINVLYKLEVGAAPLENGVAQTYLTFLHEHASDLVWYLLPDVRQPILLLIALPYIALFFAPAAAVLISRSARFQSLCIASVATLVAVDLIQVFLFEDGGRNGCTGCFLWYLLHLSLGFVSIVSAVAWNKAR